MQDQLLHAPVQNFRNVNLVFRWARDFMNPAELFRLAAGLAKYAENLAIERKLVDAAGKRV